MHRMPKEKDKFMLFCDVMRVEETAREAMWEAHSAPGEGGSYRYAHIHHARSDRDFDKGGTVRLAKSTSVPEDQRRAAGCGASLPSRPAEKVKRSPAKHGSAAAAAAAGENSARKRKGMDDTEAAVAVAGTAAANEGSCHSKARSAKKKAHNESGVQEREEREERRRELDYPNPGDLRGVDPAKFAAGSGLTNIAQLMKLINMSVTHARSACTGAITWITSKCTFKGLTIILHGKCTCCDESFSWTSGPFCDAHTTEDGVEMPKGYYYTLLLGYGIATTPAMLEHACYLLEALELRVPDKAGLYSLVRDCMAPHVSAQWDEQQRVLIEACHEKQGGIMLPTVDAAHLGTNAEVSTFQAIDAITRKTMFLETSNVGSAQGRERRAAVNMVSWAREHKLKMPVVTGDEGSALKLVSKQNVEEEAPGAGAGAASPAAGTPAPAPLPARLARRSRSMPRQAPSLTHCKLILLPAQQASSARQVRSKPMVQALPASGLTRLLPVLRPLSQNLVRL